MKAVRISKTNDADNSQKKQVKGKMVQYLGTKDSTAYKEMQQAIPQGSRLSERARRNEMSAIGEEAAKARPRG